MFVYYTKQTVISDLYISISNGYYVFLPGIERDELYYG